MIELFFYPSPNGQKIAIALEEMELPWRLTFVDITRGMQFTPAFLAISPNNKIPAILDRETPGEPLALFESGAILLYLAERSGRFLTHEPQGRHRTLQWLFWQVSALGPMAGQAHHFREFAKEKVPYGIRRYTDEVNRLYGVLNRQLQEHEFVAGDYSIADIACWPWIVHYAWQGQSLDDFPALKRWYAAVGERPAVKRAMLHGRVRHSDGVGDAHLYGQTAATVEEQRQRAASLAPRHHPHADGED